MTGFNQEVEERLIRYVQIDTQSDEHSPPEPSTAKQLDLLNLLVEELTEIGAAEIKSTPYGAVIATIPPTTAANVPTIAFLGHVDTSPAFSGTGVKPVVWRSYEGAPLTLPD